MQVGRQVGMYACMLCMLCFVLLCFVFYGMFCNFM